MTRTARQIGLVIAVSLVMGNMIGSGVFLLPASLAPYGGVSFVGWIITAGGSLFLALVFARLVRLNPAAGGPYAFTRQAFGSLAGFVVAWGYWVSCWATNAALAVAFVGYLDPFAPELVRHPPTAALMAIASLWVLTAVNARGVHAAGSVQTVTTVIKILPLLIVGFAGLAVFAPSHFAVSTSSMPALGQSVLAVIPLTLWAFLGLESATIPADSVHEPRRTIPRATIIGTAAAAVLYIVSTAGVMSAIPPGELADTSAPFAEAARVLFGDAAALFVAAGAAISCLGALNGWILITGQMPMAIARDGSFPSTFAVTSSRGTPVRGLLIGGGLSTAVIAANYTDNLVALFTFIVLLATLSVLIAYVSCSLASFFLREPGGKRLTRGAAVTAGLAFLYSLVAVGGAGADAVFWGVILMVAGLPVYFWMRWRHRPSARRESV